ncbi:hypothetical protein CANMA_001704 [Candida margitis]|uniref:uncharacterized protein n=1 Tax=Candida margitis TaxID=1775924 RepID=UPI00222660FC|nr:uncharacterized protein CANMA_001704 [Candida margitis]KAI5969257.1 hypothetical protein CANMA_001704 [Candida margitis]
MFVSFTYNKRKYEDAKRGQQHENLHTLSANESLGNNNSSNTNNTPASPAKSFNATLRIKNPNLWRNGKLFYVEMPEILPPQSSRGAVAANDTTKLESSCTPQTSPITFSYNKHKYQEALRTRTSSYLINEQSNVKPKIGTSETKQSGKVPAIKSNSSSPSKGVKIQQMQHGFTPPDSSAVSNSPQSNVSHQKEGDVPSITRTIEPNSPSKIVKLQYSTTKMKRNSLSSNIEGNLRKDKNFSNKPKTDNTLPNPDDTSKIEESSSHRGLLDSADTDPHTTLPGNKLQERHKHSPRGRPSSTSSVVSSSAILHQSSTSMSSSPSRSASSAPSPSPSPSPKTESEPIARQSSEPLIESNSSDASNSDPAREPQRSTIETCEEALDCMSQYHNIEEDISNSTLEKDDLNSYQQAEIDWFKSLVIVAGKLNDLKDTYRAIQLVKRKRAIS